jgi:hypothetical protein
MVRAPGTKMTGVSPAEQAICSEVPVLACWSTPASVLKLAKLIAGAAETEHPEVNIALTVKLPVAVVAPAAPLNAIVAMAAVNKPVFCFLSITSHPGMVELRPDPRLAQPLLKGIEARCSSESMNQGPGENDLGRCAHIIAFAFDTRTSVSRFDAYRTAAVNSTRILIGADAGPGRVHSLPMIFVRKAPAG